MLMCVAKCQSELSRQRRRALTHIILSTILWRRGESSTTSLLSTGSSDGPSLISKHSSTALSQDTATMNTSSTHQLATDEDEIPFILLTPTEKTTEDTEGDTTADDDDDDDDVEESPLQISFFLKPRRSCHKYSHSCGSPEMDAKPSSDDEEMHGCESSSADKSIMDDLCSYSSPRKSPVPTLFTSFDVMLTPPRINLLKRRRQGFSQEQQAQPEEDDNRSSSKANGPLFPVLNLSADKKKHRPNLCRPIPRHRR